MSCPRIHREAVVRGARSAPPAWRCWILGLLVVLACPARAEVDVQIIGLNDRLTDNVRALLTMSDIAGNARLSSGRVERAHQRAPDEIRTALQPYGYYEPQIDSTLTGQAPNWTATYRIAAGPPTQLRDWSVTIDGEGASFPPLEALAEQLRQREPRRLIHAEYSAAKRDLEQAAIAAGFLDAQYRTAQLRVNPQTRNATARLVLDTGPRYFFGEVTLEQDFLADRLLERYVIIEPGAPFDRQALIQQQFRFSDLGYFGNIDVEPQREAAGDDHRVPVLIRLSPRNQARWDFGIGYGTDTGARASIANEWRWINRSGHKILTDLNFSEIGNQLASEYRIPVGDQPGEHLAFEAGLESEELVDGETERWLVGTRLNRILGAWNREYYLTFTHEESRLGETRATADLLTPGVAITRAEVDDPIYARQGWSVFADLHGAESALLSTVTFLQTRVVGRFAFPLPADGRLLGRAEIGYTWTDEFDELPASQRFFAGGDQSVRGYAYQSIGPRDDSGAVIGGPFLQTYTVEAEVPVWGDVGVASFVDAGNAADDFDMKLLYGVGVGLRYRAPFGSFQVDVAHPLQRDGVRLHLGVRVGL